MKNHAFTSIVITRIELNNFKCLLGIHKNKDESFDNYIDELLNYTNNKFNNNNINGIELHIDNQSEFNKIISNFNLNEKCYKCNHSAFCKRFLNINK